VGVLTVLRVGVLTAFKNVKNMMFSALDAVNFLCLDIRISGRSDQYTLSGGLSDHFEKWAF